MSGGWDVIVVGAGVFGAWVSWHARQAGARVLLLDQYGAANARGSSGGESRVIRMAYGADEVYTRMSQASLGAWKGFFARIGQPELFVPAGVLSVSAHDNAATTHSIDVLARCGIAHEVLDAATLSRRFPQMAMPAAAIGLFEPDSGALLARRAVQAVVADFVRAGGEFRIEHVVAKAGDGMLEALHTVSGDVLRADRFVFACGPWLGRVLPDALGGRIFPTRQEVFYFGTPPGDRRFATPALPVWLDFERSYYGLPDLDGRGIKLAHDAHGDDVDPDRIERAPTPARIEHARDFLATRFPALAGAPLLGAEVCQYENTSNGDFVIDRHPGYDNAWIAGGGSGHGFKHGPAVGDHLVARMLRGAPDEPRFALATKGREQKREVH